MNSKLSIKSIITFVVVSLVVAVLFMPVIQESAFAAAKKPGKVRTLTAKVSDKKIKVAWKKAKNAKKYQIYVKVGTSAWKLKKTIKKRTFSFSGKYGTTYRIKVRALNGKRKGKFSKVRTIVVPKRKGDDNALPDQRKSDSSQSADQDKNDDHTEEDDPEDQDVPDDDGSITVYLTISDDSNFVRGNDAAGTRMARVPVKISYFDLAKYGLEQYYRYEAAPFEEGGRYINQVIVKQPTVMMLLIRAIEKWYYCREMTKDDVGKEGYSVTGAPTSSYMTHFWGHGDNLMYYVNHAYPLQREGWGSTSDYILLMDGDEIDVAMFSDRTFYGRGAFAYFDNTNPLVSVGDRFEMRMLSSGTSAGVNGKTVNEGAPMPYENIRVSNDKGRTWKEKVYKTDKNGYFTAMFDKPGVYYVSGGPKFTKQGDSSACIAAPISVVEVAPGKVEEYRARSISSTAVRYSWEKIDGVKTYTVAYKKSSDTGWTTIETSDTKCDISGLDDGSSYVFKVRASSESDYVPIGEKKRELRGEYSDEAVISLGNTGSGSGQDAAITITEQPEDISVAEGGTAEFSVSHEGKGLRYQWYRSTNGKNYAGEPIEGATSSSYSFDVSLKDRNTCYYCVIANESEMVKTEAAKLDLLIEEKAYIVSQTEAVSTFEGREAQFSVDAMGFGELTYQWYRNDTDTTEGGEAVEGATFSTYTKNRVYRSNSGEYYYCVVTDTIKDVLGRVKSVTTATTEPILLTVAESPEHTKAVQDIRRIIKYSGVRTTDTVTIDGQEFYVLAYEDGKALLFSKGEAGYKTYSLSGDQTWKYDGPGARVYLNTTYLSNNATIDVISLPTTYYTPDTEVGFKELTDKVFTLSEADVTGDYSYKEYPGRDAFTVIGDPVIRPLVPEKDFSFDRSAAHQGIALPKEIAELYVDGNLEPWYLRSYYNVIKFQYNGEDRYTISCSRVVYDDDGPIVEVVKKPADGYTYARSAFWVEVGDDF